MSHKPIYPLTKLADLSAETVRAGKGVRYGIRIGIAELRDLESRIEDKEHPDPELFDLVVWRADLGDGQITVRSSKKKARLGDGGPPPPDSPLWADPVEVTATGMKYEVKERTNIWGVAEKEAREGGAGRGLIFLFGGRWMHLGFQKPEDATEETEAEWRDFCAALNERNHARGFASPFPEDRTEGRKIHKRKNWPLFQQICPECGNLFMPTRRGQVYDKRLCAAKVGERRRRRERVSES